MRRILLLISIASIIISGCSKSKDSANENASNIAEKYITVSFDFDELYEKTSPNIYVIWLENENSGELQHIYVCKRITDGSLDEAVKETALPFWHMHRYDKNNKKIRREVDSVTGATIVNKDFSKTVKVDPLLGTEFTLYFEIDQSFQWNDWFEGPYLFDQQAVIYKANIDLKDDINEYSLEPIGWTPNQDYSVAGNTYKAGELITEVRFITHSRIDDKPTFGAPNTEFSAIRSIKSIRASISETL